MEYTKQPLSISDQTAMLKARGLIFADEQKAQQMLATVSYFRLAAFLRPMEADKTTHQYKPNATFEKAVALYEFDAELPRRLQNPWLNNTNVTFNKLYPQLCCIAYWLRSIDPQSTFVADLKTLLVKYPTVDIAAMGFPKGWQQEPLWQ